MSMRGTVISLINMKGGVGKTTLCREIGLFLSEKFCRLNDDGTSDELKVLLIDIDPQSNLTQSLLENLGKESVVYKYDENGEIKKDSKGKPIVEYKCSIDNLFKGDMSGLQEKHIILELSDNLHLIPGELETVFLQRQQNSQTPFVLRNYIIEKKLKEKYDFILLDCPPTYSVYTEMSFYASDYYLVPAVPDAYSSLGVDLLERVVKDIVHGQRFGIFEHARPKNIGVIWSRVDLKYKPRQQVHMDALLISETITQNGIKTLDSSFEESNKLSTSPFEKTIIDRNDSKLNEILTNICKELISETEVDVNEVIVEKE
ncbi:ParA family protein [Lysinibacillus fusiformis]|uniref:ParA family protein n=1 Tax=Lysinibacillus fusiformis TaxID=28031 RepID=UPI0019679C18|nr:ParA family protein [Lysinibacillus fusiformis]QSB09088.1 ParA family protein [Lysinibacillus fusiformis]